MVALRDIRYAFRSFRRAPLTAATIVVTVGLGLGLVAAIYTLVNAFIFRVDEVRSPHEIFGVERGVPAVEDPAIFTRSEYDALLRETDVFVDAFASSGDNSALIEGVRREGRLVTGNFFRVVGAGAERGRAFAPADDEPGSAAVLVLSHRAWTQHYDSDPTVVGRTYRVNDTPFEIIGVMPEGFRGLEIFAPDFWVPLAQAGTFERTVVLEAAFDGIGDLAIVGRLKPGVTSGQAQAQLVAWDSQREAARAAGSERPASLVLTPRMGTLPRPAEAVMVFMPLFFAFGLILMIGCANVANLLLARLLTRQREIGIRLSIGASRRRVVWQLLTESLLLALISAAFAFVISRLALNAIEYFLVTSFPPDIGNLRLDVPAADWRVVLFLVAGAFVATVLFALGPALKSTRLDIARTIHGQVLGDARPGRARNALIALQVTGSALLLICAGLFLRGAWSAANVDPGVRTADTVSVTVLNEQKRADILERLRSESAVTGVAAAWPGFMGGLGGAPAYGEGATGRQVVRYQFVSPEFFDVLGIDLVRGRGFTDAERNANEGVAIVSEAVALELWPGADAIGQVLRVEPDPTIGQERRRAAAATPPSDDPLLEARTAVVVGVARDVAGFLLGAVRLGGAGVYMPIDTDVPMTALTLRVRGDVEVARRVIADRFATLDPNMAQISTLQTLARTNTYILGTSFWLTLVLGVLALLLTVSGLFSVLSYLVEQRTREIGVRMALGASGRSVGALVLKQSAWPVGIGLGVGCTLVAGVSAALLATPAAEQIGSIVQLLDPVAYGASITCIVAACAGAALIPALRAGRVNPLAALRQD